MEQVEVSGFSKRLQGVLSQELLNGIGRRTRFWQRERVLTPFGLVGTLLSALATSKVESIADLHRAFVGLCRVGLEYKPFHNWLAKRAFAVFMREVALELITSLAVRVLRFPPNHPFSEFAAIIIHDGSSFAVHDALRKVFPGRFKTVSPAAIEMHVSIDLLEGAPKWVVLTADTASEQRHAPAAKTLRGKLILLDRGYFALEYFADIADSEGSFLARGKSSMNPLVITATAANGKRLKKFEDKQLKRGGSIPKDGPVDMLVEWKIKGKKELFRCRLIIVWNPRTKSYTYIVTNLLKTKFSTADLLTAYRLRWQIELLFKEWKSYANLHRFNTSKQPIVEGFIWAALAASTLKRYFAHAAQILTKTETSTRKVAMCLAHTLSLLFDVLVHKTPRHFLEAFSRIIQHIATVGARAHPKRDRISGRLALGMQPIFGSA